MPSKADAQRIALRLHALGGGPEVRRKAAARELAVFDPTDATELIDHLLGLAREGHEPSRCVLSSFVAALVMEADEIPHAADLRRLASIQDLEAVAAMFPSGPAREEMNPDEAQRRDAKLFTEPLGTLKTKARITRNPDELARLALVSDPSVIRNALLNPRLTEDLVVRIAARRPARPEPLIEIWKAARWSARHTVRRALAFNPYLPPEVGSKIVPTLSAADWRELAADTGIHDSLRREAKLLLERGRAPKLSALPDDPIKS